MSQLYSLPADIRNEFEIDSEGKVWATASGTARLAGITAQSLLRPVYGLLDKLRSASLKDIPESLQLFAGFDFKENKGKNNSVIIPYELAILILKYYYMRGKFTSNGLKLIDMPAPAEKIKKNYHKPKILPKSEKYYLKKLFKELGGVVEVPTLAGRIDLLTSTQIIEVKEISAWKGAIGQVLVYSAYYPSHEKRIHLFGETQESFLDEVRKHTDRLGIILTWES